MITLRCVARPTPTAPSFVSKPSWHETVPITTPNTAAFSNPVKRSFSSAIDMALAMAHVENGRDEDFDIDEILVGWEIFEKYAKKLKYI